MKVCIIGYGAIGPVHAESIKKLDGIELYGICDTDHERADAGAEKYKAKAFYSFDECIENPNIHSVHICTPHYLHFEMIKKAVYAGKNVVVEKPIVMKKDELDVLMNDFKNADIFPIVQNRTNSCIRHLKKITDTDKSLGVLTGIKGVVAWMRDAKYYNQDSWRGTKAFEGGGVLINQAVHTLDLMIYFGGSVNSVSAAMSNKSLSGIIEVEDTADALIDFTNGAKGILYATNAYSINSPVQLELHFENADFLYYGGKLFKNGELICSDDAGYSGKVYWGCGHERTLYDHYIKHSGPRLCDISETMYTMFAIYESAAANRQIKL